MDGNQVVSDLSQMSGMYVGLILLLIIVLAAAYGYKKGLAGVLYSFIIFVISFVGTKLIMIYLIANQEFSAIVFVGAMIVLNLGLAAVGKALHLIDRIPILRSINKFSGLIVGLLFGYSLVQAVLCLFGLLVGMGFYVDFAAAHVDTDPIVKLLQGIDVFSMLDSLLGSVKA